MKVPTNNVESEEEEEEEEESIPRNKMKIY